jgi:hypothetical protein
MRDLTPEEFAVCAKLISSTSDSEALMAQLASAKAMPLADGGMGSLRFVLQEGQHRDFGERLAEGEARDTDGTPLFFSLLSDRDGKLFELEVWRVDFGPIQSFPSAESVLLI